MAIVTFGTAPVNALGDKVVSDINAQSWTPAGGQALQFAARRIKWIPAEYEPTDQDLHVDLLVALLDDEELVDRGNNYARTFVVAIGIQKVLANRTDEAESDALMDFVEALRTYYDVEVEFVVTGSQRARCTKRETPILYSTEEIDKNSRFFSVIHLTFEGWYEG